MTDSRALAGKTILLVSTGSERKRFILERMKSLGLKIVVLDDHLEPWAAPLVSGSILVKRETPLKTLLERVHRDCEFHQVEGAITFWEEEIPLLSHICQTCGFIGNKVETGMNTRSKFVMQELFRERGVPAIRQRILESDHDLTEAMSSIGFPAVLKPLFGSDSLSVIRVDSPEQATRAFGYVQESFTMPYEKLFRYQRGGFVYQEFIAGPEFSVECYCQNGVPSIAGIHEKTPMQPPFFVETGDYIPPRISDQQRSALIEGAIAGLKALGVEESLAHVEIKWTHRGPQIIEIASRMGGDYTYHGVKSAYGFDMVRAGCEIALGTPVTETPAPTGRFILGRYFIPRVSGVITEIGDADLLRSFPGVCDFHLASRAGEEILVPPNGFDNAGWVTVEGETIASAERRLEHILKSFPLTICPQEENSIHCARDPRCNPQAARYSKLRADPCLS